MKTSRAQLVGRPDRWIARWSWRLAPVLLVATAMTAQPTRAAGVCFTDIAAGLPGGFDGAVAWGDYDNDGDLDILLTGKPSGVPISSVYRNSGGPTPTFTDILTGLPGVLQSAVAWADFNNDGYLDILLTGNTGGGTVLSRVYKSSGGANPLFTDLLAGLPGVWSGAVAVGDYDNDGDLDFVLTGASATPGVYIARVYRNNGGAHPTFTDIAAGLPAVTRSVAAWGDYDKDGDLDLLLTGFESPGYIARVYRNSGGVNPTFSYAFDAGGGLNGAAAWGDYDNDGDLDIVAAGGEGPQASTLVFHNFAEVDPVDPFFDYRINIGLSGVQKGAAAWADYDNDGDLDVLLAGYNGLAPSAKVYASSGGEFPTFTDINAGLTGVGTASPFLLGCAAAWGDYDNDGRVDVLLTGPTMGTTSITRIYRNTCGSVNAPPQAPTNLHTSLVGSRATFSWDAATDAETASSGLSYNLRVGTAPGLADLVSPMASLATGYRRVVALGNTNLRTTWEIELPALVPYYWSVQAVDGAFAGSPFAPERSTTTDVEGNSPPQTDALHTKGPNPFTSTTTIEFSHSRAGRVSLVIYDSKGRRVRTLANEELRPGHFTRSWNGTDDAGRSVPSGFYFVRMQTASFVKTEKISLVK